MDVFQLALSFVSVIYCTLLFISFSLKSLPRKAFLQEDAESGLNQMRAAVIHGSYGTVSMLNSTSRIMINT